MEANKEISEFIFNWRIILKLTAKNVSERADISLNTYKKIEKGDMTIKLESFLKILKVFGIENKVINAIDPFNSDIGRIRMNEMLPKRIRK